MADKQSPPDAEIVLTPAAALDDRLKRLEESEEVEAGAVKPPLASDACGSGAGAWITVVSSVRG